MSRRLDRSFFSTSDTIGLAKKLLGQVMCRSITSESLDSSDTKSKGSRNSCEKILRARIVETEAYLGSDDTASLSFNGRRTEANEPMYMDAGTVFVYMTYGMHNMMNISSSEEGGAVLIRALEPLEGIDSMRLLRSRSKKNPMKSRSGRQEDEDEKEKNAHRLEDLCSGPAKLCHALDITKGMNKEDLVSSNTLWLEEGIDIHWNNIETTQRIGLGSRAGSWATKEMRYFIRGNPHVSKVPSPKKSKTKKISPAEETSDPRTGSPKKRKVTKKKGRLSL
jgi:DNA-3-methyladenine glycosylase